MHNISSQQFYDLIVPLVKEVGAYQRSRIHETHQVEFKNSINLVTEVDKKSEHMIVSALQGHFPDHDIMAEEGSGERKDSPYKWIIDPLDGTTNYAHTYPVYAVSVGLEFQGRIVGGVIYDPSRDELFKAFEHEGAFLNDKKISVSQVAELDRSLLVTGFAYNYRQVEDNNFNHFEGVSRRSQAVRRDGVATLDMCAVACGRFEGFWELYLFPWDTAAGLVIAVEAGARVSRFDGSPYSIYEREILLTNGKIHEQMVDVLQQGRKQKAFC